MPQNINDLAFYNEESDNFSHFNGVTPEDRVRYSANQALLTKNMAETRTAKVYNVFFTIEHIGPVTDPSEKFYLHPGLLKELKEEGVMSKVNGNMVGIGSSEAKLKVTQASTDLAWLYRELNSSPSYAEKINITSSNSNGIQKGLITVSRLSPTGNVKEGEKNILFSNFNDSKSTQNTKAELSEVMIPLASGFCSVVEIAPATTLTIHMQVTSLQKSSIANYKL